MMKTFITLIYLLTLLACSNESEKSDSNYRHVYKVLLSDSTFLKFYKYKLIAPRDGDETDVYFYPRIGRSLNFSERTGINCDIGAFFPLSKGARDFFDSPIYPSGSISFFIRL